MANKPEQPPEVQILSMGYPERTEQLIVQFETERVAVGVVDEQHNRYLYRIPTPGADRRQQERIALDFIDRHRPALIDGQLSLRFFVIDDCMILPIEADINGERVAPNLARLAFHPKVR